MMSSRFDPSSTSKPLNLSLLRFNKRSGSENHGFKWSVSRPRSDLHNINNNNNNNNTIVCFNLVKFLLENWIKIGQIYFHKN